MKTNVEVTLRGEEMVTIEVEHDEGDDPTDLTKEDAKRARKAAGVDSTWEIANVTVVKEP